MTFSNADTIFFLSQKQRCFSLIQFALLNFFVCCVSATIAPMLLSHRFNKILFACFWRFLFDVLIHCALKYALYVFHMHIIVYTHLYMYTQYTARRLNPNPISNTRTVEFLIVNIISSYVVHIENLQLYNLVFISAPMTHSYK